jgi:hypothetical protein
VRGEGHWEFMAITLEVMLEIVRSFKSGIEEVEVEGGGGDGGFWTVRETGRDEGVEDIVAIAL